MSRQSATNAAAELHVDRPVSTTERSSPAFETYFRETCPACGRVLRVPVELLGKPVQCEHCRRGFVAHAPSLDPADRDLRRRIKNFLHNRGIRGAEAIRVEVRGGVVELRGKLPSRHEKWLCLNCCQRVAGVIRVIDNLRYVGHGEPSKLGEPSKPGELSKPGQQSQRRPRKPR